MCVKPRPTLPTSPSISNTRRSSAREHIGGVQYVAEKGGAYWLIDEIAFGQVKRKIAAEPFQVWTLKVKTDQTARITCEDGNGKRVFTKRLDYTDFPLNEISFYLTDNVLMLPSEY